MGFASLCFISPLIQFSRVKRPSEAALALSIGSFRAPGLADRMLDHIAA
jgi:hypothetical protein